MGASCCSSYRVWQGKAVHPQGCAGGLLWVGVQYMWCASHADTRSRKYSTIQTEALHCGKYSVGTIALACVYSQTFVPGVSACLLQQLTALFFAGHESRSRMYGWWRSVWVFVQLSTPCRLRKAQWLCSCEKALSVRTHYGRYVWV
jgi:hypothetical protein